MPRSELRLLKRAAIHWPKSDVGRIPDNTRGLYFLYDQQDDFMNVIYIGIARGIKTGIKRRIKTHSRSTRMKWTHFSAYEVHDNISESEIKELEAFFLTAYAKDAHANKQNLQRGDKKLRGIRDETRKAWPKS